MTHPRRHVIRSYAEGVHHPDPDHVTLRDLEAHIDQMPEDGWIGKEDKEYLKQRINYELDGARPFA
jgi:hypothetical protein